MRKYYDRIKNQFQNIDPIQTTAKFLSNQSIGTTIEEISEVLNYYKDKLREDVSLLDFAIEWIRANQIRLEYKKYLIRATYPNGDLALAVDDCISTFYLNYDRYIREYFTPFIQEHEISTLYEVFFSPYDKKQINFSQLLEIYKEKVPTIFEEKEKINTNIITLRAGLSKVIVEDFEPVLASRMENSQKNIGQLSTPDSSLNYTSSTSKVKEASFDGTRLASIVRACCFAKSEMPEREFENAVSHFLASFFNISKFYKFDDFKNKLMDKFVEFILLGITERYLKATPEVKIRNILVKTLLEFREINKIQVFDGLSWKNDLKPILTKAILKLVNIWLNDESWEPSSENDSPEIEAKEIKLPELSSNIDDIDFKAIFELNLSVETFRDTLEKLLENSDMSLIEKRNFLRNKVSEFKMNKRKNL